MSLGQMKSMYVILPQTPSIRRIAASSGSPVAKVATLHSPGVVHPKRLLARPRLVAQGRQQAALPSLAGLERSPLSSPSCAWKGRLL